MTTTTMSLNEKLARGVIDASISNNVSLIHYAQGLAGLIPTLTDKECRDISVNYPLSYSDIRAVFPHSPPHQERVMTAPALQDVIAERKRQVEEKGFDSNHDDRNSVGGTLAMAASCYALYEDPRRLPEGWPWDARWWKPTTRRHNMVKAAALLLAEIERLDRRSQSFTVVVRQHPDNFDNLVGQPPDKHEV